MKKNYLFGHISQITSIILWTGAIVVTKIVTIGFSPFMIVPLQMSIGTIIIFFIFFVTRIKIYSKGVISGVLFGLIAPGLAFSFLMLASTKTDALSMIIFWSLLPLLTPIFGKIFLSERISPILYVGLTIALFGTYLLIYMRSSQGTSNTIGNVFAVCGVFCSIIGHIIGRGFNKKLSKPAEMALGQVLGATITSSFILLINVIIVDFNINELIYITDLLFMPAFIYLVIFGTVINFLLYNFALSKIEVAWVSFYSVFIPPLGAIFSFIILDEKLSHYDMFAISIIFLGSLIPPIHKFIFSK